MHNERHTKRSSICAVVVTFNRKAVLPAALRALAAQTRHLDEIIVVDNDSRDGTDAMVRADYPEVTYLRLPENLGYAAGLAAGMEDGYRRGHNYFWLLDDDSAPESDALARCEAVARAHRGFGIVGLNGGIWRRGGPRHFRSVPAADRGQVLAEGETACDFVLVDGALVSRQAVDAAGYPRKDFFMMMEDIEYSQRIKRAGLQVFVLEEGLIDRQHLGSTGSGGVPWRGYYQTRNHLAMVLSTRSPMDLFGWLERQARFIGGTVLYGNQKSKRIRLRLLGAWHGLIGKMGRTIDPAATKKAERSSAAGIPT